MSITNLVLIIIILLLAAYCGRLKLRQQEPERRFSESFSMKLQLMNDDVMQHIRKTTDAFRILMESRNINFSVEITPESMMGWIDADKADTIMLLLLSDMLRNATNDSKITVHANTNSSYDQITIRISDNGPKISNISLSLSNHLTRLHHGNFLHEYYEEQGNTVIIEVPINKDAYAAEQPNVQLTDFHIPSNVTLQVPTIDLPTGYENSEKSLEAIIQQNYVSADQEYLQRAIRCINEHIMDSDYDRETFAADMGSSVSTLYNKVRATTGKNITNFIRDIRIKKACQLAKENPDLRVSDLAYQVGFKDPKYFATSFKRVMGMQPKEYINEVRGKREEVRGKKLPLST